MGFVDPYIDEKTGELRNLIGAKSQEEFRRVEPQIVFANELELESIGIPRSDDLAEVRAIHRQLFHNVYDWAGEIRVVDIKKNEDGADFFLIVSMIPRPLVSCSPNWGKNAPSEIFRSTASSGGCRISMIS